jgi:hypothetical protein
MPDATGADGTARTHNVPVLHASHGVVPLVGVAPETIASDEHRDDACWARLYTRIGFEGEALTLLGPLDAPNVWSGGGFPWDPEFESLAVGPDATLAIYGHRNFEDRSATFGPDRRVAALDRVMGVFRKVRSLKLTCGRLSQSAG